MTDERIPAQFLNAIRTNCDIADADGAAIFSICGMALRLRDLNKWEQQLAPWQENDPKVLLAWIDAKEQTWEKTAGQDFLPLPLDGHEFDPFDTRAVNKRLLPLGLFYGAGYAHSLKPTFFLAKVRDTFNETGFTVRVLGQELARDLLTLPALNQDNAVVLRTDASRLFVWDQMAYLKKSGQPFLKFALRQCGLPGTGTEERKAHFEDILAVQARVYIDHEIGELTDQVFHRDLFQEILSAFPHSAVELLARTVRDLLADTGPRGPLSRIITTRDAAALGFYAAFQDGLFRPLFPELRPAVEKFVADRDWEGIQRARAAGFETARHKALDLTEIYAKARAAGKTDQAAQKIQERLVQPLLN